MVGSYNAMDIKMYEGVLSNTIYLGIKMQVGATAQRRRQMPIDPFVILGISKDSSQSEILEAYKTKRAYYQEHVFDEGDQGAQAARMLGQLDDAYQQAMELSHESATVSGESESSFDSVRDSIRNKDVEGAQRALDEISYRGAEWHYYQSIVFYEKNWLNEQQKAT